MEQIVPFTQGSHPLKINSLNERLQGRNQEQSGRIIHGVQLFIILADLLIHCNVSIPSVSKVTFRPSGRESVHSFCVSVIDL